MKKIFLSTILLLVAFAGFATNYYSLSTGNLDNLSTWGVNPDGSGAHPPSFLGGDIFIVVNNMTPTVGANWVVSGTGSKIVVGNSSDAINFTIPSGVTVTGTVDVTAAATLTIQSATAPTIGSVLEGTVVYSGTGAQNIKAGAYGALVISGARGGSTITFANPTTTTISVYSLSVTATAVTYSMGTSTIEYNKPTGGVSVTGVLPYYALKMSNTSGTNTATGDLTVTNAFTTTAGGSIDMATFMLSASTITNNGTILTQNLSSTPIPSGKTIGGTVIYNALTGGQTIVPESSYANLVLANTSGTNTPGAGNIAIQNTGSLTTTTGGTLNMGSTYKITTVGTGTLPTITNDGVISTLVTTNAIQSGKVWGGTGKIVYAVTTGGQSIVAGTYNCRLQSGNSSGINSASGTITANDSFITTAGGTVSFGGSSQLLGTIKPANNGTITTAFTGTAPSLPGGATWGGTVVFTAGGSHIATGTFNNLSFTNATSTVTADGDLTVNGAFTTTSGGTLAMGTSQLNGSPTSITHNGTLTTASTANPGIFAGNWGGSGGTSAVQFNSSTGGQFIPGGTYKALSSLNASGTNTVVGGNLVVTGGFTVTGAGSAGVGGTLDMGTNALSVAGNITMGANGTISTQNTSSTPLPARKFWGYPNVTSSSSGTVIYNGTGAQTVVAGSYNNVVVSGARTGSPVLTLAVDTIRVSGDFNITATGIGSYSTTSNTVLFTSSTDSDIPGITYNNLIFTNTSGTKTATGNINVNNKLLTTTGGTFSLGTYSLGGTLSTVVNNGIIKTLSTTNPALPAGQNWSGTTGTVEFGSLTGGQYIPGGTYKNLRAFNTSDTNRVVGNLTITGTLTKGSSPGAMDMGTNRILSVASVANTDGVLITKNTTSLPLPQDVTWRGAIVYAASGNQTIVHGVYDGDLVIAGTRTGTPTITLDNTGIIDLKHNFITSYTGAVNIVTTGSTVKYSSTEPGIVAALSYGYLYLSGGAGAVKTAAGNIVINDSLGTESGGIFDLATYQLSGTLTSVTNNGTIKTSALTNPALPAGVNWTRSGTGTIEFGSLTGGQYIPSGTYSSLKVLSTGTGKDSVVGNIVMNGGVLTDSGTLDFGIAALSGTGISTAGDGTIMTSNTSASPFPNSLTWTPLVEYKNATGGQTIMSGTYSGGLTNSNTSGFNFVIPGGALTVDNAFRLKVGSTLSDSGAIINVIGNLTGIGTHRGTGKIVMNGSAAQTISGATLGNLELNNASGFTSTGNITVNGTMTFTNGILNIGSNNLIFGETAAVAGTPGASSFIAASNTAEVRKMFTGTGSFLYPIGDNGPNYTPVTLNFTDGTFAGGAYAGVKVVNLKHPSNANITNFINRYWSVNTSGITGPVYDIDATYAESDIVGTESLVTAAKFSSALPWIKFSATNTTTNLLSGTGIVDVSFDFSGISGIGPVVDVTPAEPSICSGNSVVLDASGTTGVAPITYSWSPSTGLSATTGSIVTVTLSTTTTMTQIYTITATDGNGISTSSTVTVTVNALATAIGGAMNVCEGLTTTLSNGTTGGTWTSSNVAVATIGSSDGVVTGIVAGVTDITYTAPGGCATNATVTVFPTPAAIMGSNTLCIGTVTTLTNSVTGGTWTSGNTSIATVGTSDGIVTGVGAGVADITYTAPGGCQVARSVTVSGMPAAITGAANVCQGATTTLSNVSSGGTWSSSNTAIATIGSSDGVVTGVSDGVVDITYSIPGGCNVTTTITVFPIPTAITGTNTFCTGGTATFTNGVAGGTWTSANTSVATIGSSSGDVMAVGIGNTVISYTDAHACGTVTKTITVDLSANAGTITGASSVFTGSTITLSDAVSGGVWSASNGNATVSPTGDVTGVSAGAVVISYTVTTACGTASATKAITVNPGVGTIGGVLSVCVGGTTTLTNSMPGGNWTSSGFPTIINIGYSTGVVTGVSAGTAAVTYGGPGNYTYTVVTVNPLPGVITGASNVCLGSTTTLTNSASGGTWTSSNATIASIDPSTGVVTGNVVGSATITYTLPTGCLRTFTMTVKPVPAAIVGASNVCVGGTAVMTDPTSGGVSWSSSNPSIASIGAASGVLTGMSGGTATITYTVVSGCVATKVVTVDAGLPAITGTPSVCVGSTTTLGNATAGGVWTNSPTTIASIGSASGVVTGLISGSTVVTYTAGSCKVFAVVTVNAQPSAITGTPAICIGSTYTLSSATTGGTWTSSATGIATVGAATGVVTGVTAGNATISYTNALGCSRTIIATVTAAPSITGTMSLCIGNTATLNSSVPGGTWLSSNTAVATIASGTGVLTGVSSGNSNITYTLSATCKASVTVTVGSGPAAITGPSALCSGSTITLSSATTGGVWSTSGSASIATVDAGTGVVSGVGSGTIVITYSVGAGCYQLKTVTVGSGLGSITGNTGLCIGASTTYISTSPSVGLGWSSSNPSVATVGAASGVVTGVSAGTANITFTPYSFSAFAGCTAVKTVTVDAAPSVMPITGPSGVLVGSTVTLSDATPGGTWTSNSPARATVSSTGVVTGIAAPAVTISYSVTNGACVFTVTKLLTVTTHKPGIAGPVGADELVVYPNPTSGTFTLQAPAAGSFTIYSLEGKEVTRVTVAEGLNQISMPAGIAAGVYMCRFNGDNDTSIMVRLMYEPR